MSSADDGTVQHDHIGYSSTTVCVPYGDGGDQLLTMFHVCPLPPGGTWGTRVLALYIYEVCMYLLYISRYDSEV